MDEYVCRFCGKICKNKNSLVQHEIRCKLNSNRIKCCGNKNNMPKHCKKWKYKQVVARNGDILDITNEQLENYRMTHTKCEICGRNINETVKTLTRFSPKQMCVDHDHNTLKFRGLLCTFCNRQLGWYEANKEAIKNYLER